jgi:UDP-N-acetyl-2-amino-2-deoxyglucuronate dehydrogenase
LKTFALIGAAGYIAPRHLKAIKETNNNLVVSVDPHDNVGILDTYFPESLFFSNFERFDRFINKLKSQNQKIDYFSICSPNYLHDYHIRYALQNGSDVICEKPTVLNPWNYEAIKINEQQLGKKVYSILQLRLHPEIIKLKEKVQNAVKDKVFEVDLTYITSRGKWYHSSWKGDETKSGGIATNIGIHFFDMLIWVFGSVKDCIVTERNSQTVSGYLELERARIKWFLSIDYQSLPQEIKENGKRTFRFLKINDDFFDFTSGFEDLHTKSYQEILNGNGFELAETEESVNLVYRIRNQKIKNLL